jgi:hypothetical protein
MILKAFLLFEAINKGIFFIAVLKRIIALKNLLKSMISQMRLKFIILNNICLQFV